MELTIQEWVTLIGIPLGVSIAANILTPFVRKAIKSSGKSFLKGATGSSNALIAFKENQIKKEIHELEKLRNNPEALIDLLDGSIQFSKISLWALLISPVFAFILSQFSPHLPWLYSNPAFTGASVIAAIAAAGPFQAAIYASIVQRKLKKVRQSETHIATLKAQLNTIKNLKINVAEDKDISI
jgi:hypothetical protein